jgi:hypothetical protein
MTQEALKLALEALERVSAVDDDCDILTPSLTDAVVEAIDVLKEALAKQEQGELVAFKIYKPTPPRHAITNVRDAELPWVYDQDPSSGNVASMWVTPVQTLRSKS